MTPSNKILDCGENVCNPAVERDIDRVWKYYQKRFVAFVPAHPKTFDTFIQQAAYK
jgi:hypothetical protein